MISQIDLTNLAKKYFEPFDPDKPRIPKSMQTRKFSNENFCVWVSGDRKEIYLKVDFIKEGFSHDDDFCKIERDLLVGMKRDTISIGLDWNNRATIKVSEAHYSYYQLCEYFNALCDDSEVNI